MPAHSILHPDEAVGPPARPPAFRGRICFAAVVLLMFVYVSAFWGSAAQRLPDPLCRWAYIAKRAPQRWWLSHVAASRLRVERLALLNLAVEFGLGLLVPALLLRAAGRRPRDYGLRTPNALGWRLLLAGVALSVPFGLWLLYDQREQLQNVLKYPMLWHAQRLLSMVPEHFLICGVVTGLLLPERRLPDAVPIPSVEGSRPMRALRWLGLAQPGSGPSRNAVLEWLGLDGTSLAALCASGLIFGLVHIGKAPLELTLSFPGGVAVAYLTLRSQSIWPAITAHWAMNLVPAGLWLAWR
jgi:hypothetical protein